MIVVKADGECWLVVEGWARTQGVSHRVACAVLEAIPEARLRLVTMLTGRTVEAFSFDFWAQTVGE